MRCRPFCFALAHGCGSGKVGSVTAELLPPDAAQYVAEFEQVVVRIREKAEAQILELTADAAAELLRLQNDYAMDGQLEQAIAIRDHVRTLNSFLERVLPDPVDLKNFRGRDGQNLLFEVVGGTAGVTYGTNIYSEDTQLATAAVHAGLLQEGQRGYVSVTLFDEVEKLVGSEQNSVESRDWEYPIAAYSVCRPGDEPPTPQTEIMAGPPHLRDYRKQAGKSFLFAVKGDATGKVYGTTIYTDDSALATAAVHEGILQDGEIGLIRAFILGPAPSFQASTKNGVESRPYGPWGGSYRLEAADLVVGASPADEPDPAADEPDVDSAEDEEQEAE